MVSNDEQKENINLEHLLSIWPITACLATYTSAGDLISLARTSSNTRALTHGFPVSNASTSLESRQEILKIGRHQTTYWANLKASSRFTCSNPTHPHTKDHPTHPCRFCSQPICRACIVRTFFANPHENTFKHRARYLCITCWETGNLRKDFRYPVDHVSREQIWRGRSYTQRGSFCSCSASLDNWLCIPCKKSQNASAPANQTLTAAPSADEKKINPNDDFTPQHMKCYGLDCENDITESDRDRRRICLWCSKPLPRQFAGEDRLRWETKQVEIRAAAAASRSADIAEWARNRFRTLTMSRREMRGDDACLALTNGKDSSEHERPLFVRHLDAVNYRSLMSEFEAPSPESVYQSKHGRWTYSRAFMIMMNLSFKLNISMTSINGVNITLLNNSTHDGSGLDGARTNKELFRQLHSPPDNNKVAKHFSTAMGGKTFRLLVRYKTVLSNARLLNLHDDLRDAVFELENDVDCLEHVIECLFEQVDVWEGLDDEGRRDWVPRDLKMLMMDVGCPRTKQVNGQESRMAKEDDDKMNGLLTYEDVERLGARVSEHRSNNHQPKGENEEQKGRKDQRGSSETDSDLETVEDVMRDSESEAEMGEHDGTGNEGVPSHS
ncbi:hypothetical protein H2198_003853 [Neophaeococcomyces mojaviensis]|uniref:Uncharacterized protein n=1 Tax=Neophaeococcomyces mojaviensis TaxID=3383035 RepID=A0ACC3AA32_9EURO|nr:hypothetical protein H2198_003853 [Knufia sp. JES_112]